jgi:hypothetical protein
MRRMVAVGSIVAGTLTLITACGTGGPGAVGAGRPEGLASCPMEDSPGPCYWDAQLQGNHKGTSFWVDGDQRVHYVG